MVLMPIKLEKFKWRRSLIIFYSNDIFRILVDDETPDGRKNHHRTINSVLALSTLMVDNRHLHNTLSGYRLLDLFFADNGAADYSDAVVFQRGIAHFTQLDQRLL